MNIIVGMRQDLLGNLKDSIIAVDSVDRAIYFYDDTEAEICRVYFNSIEDAGSSGDIATYQFFSLDGSSTMRGTVSTPGLVKTFKIKGILPGRIYPDDVISNFITGTVGGFTSSADMKFNKTSWVAGMNISISNLYLVMK
jgi:hypothetical protein